MRGYIAIPMNANEKMDLARELTKEEWPSVDLLTSSNTAEEEGLFDEYARTCKERDQAEANWYRASVAADRARTELWNCLMFGYVPRTQS